MPALSSLPEHSLGKAIQSRAVIAEISGPRDVQHFRELFVGAASIEIVQDNDRFSVDAFTQVGRV